MDVDEESIQLSFDGKPYKSNRIYFKDGFVLFPAELRYNLKAVISYKLNDGSEEEKEFDMSHDSQRKAFLVPYARIIDKTEVITVDGLKLSKDFDYAADYNLGLFVFNRNLPENAEVRIDYDYTVGSNNYVTENLSGQTGSTFNLNHGNILTIKIVRNNTVLAENLDYSITYATGVLTLFSPLTTNETVVVNYNYVGLRQDVTGGFFEYKLSDNTNIGISLTTVSPRKEDENLYTTFSPSSFSILNLYGKTYFNENSYLFASLASGDTNLDIRTNATKESDTSINIEGRTQYKNLILNASYRATGLRFPSIKEVKQGVPWKSEDKNIALEYLLGKKLSFKVGYGTSTSQEGSASLPSLNLSLISLGMNFNPTDFLNLGLDSKMQNDTISSSQSTVGGLSNLLYMNLELNHVMPIVASLTTGSELIVKYLVASQKNRIDSSFNVVDSDIQKNELQIGTLNKFGDKLSLYLLSKTSEEKDASNSISNNTYFPSVRASYFLYKSKTSYLELFGDYGFVKDTGTKNTEQKNTSYGLSYNTYYDATNTKLLGVKLVLTMKTSNYEDLNNLANNYSANDISFMGEIDF
ncbi:hypothetical protein A2526_00075 [candidate division WOR-1 bacterium RIFOXYD2_FULL_36_8]|uniref:Uncharacterized protein n=1 Tax=candidate division WOR-1 bacterium RIFOXYB2_FULL_36_35 TaxID=1802578 RepID=A0A1F4S8I6_UNCSA|nr:MAG: hypothetical protein A2230_07050 [candidate division WOR-1 bacterium RIFOXYA2_FULL_36_21]OGC16765.1 MAG: hypothetical protein A2290_00205 [candidate division WOR-1 bacterium RIFOXYB2_FULL_36_35]OGC19734.1 MAG: hypothetical protein A2282_08890 [candidate division WOR-1 bacterium RIFOXYA12_FULL_36_13]OGC38886.1 MAG: hypothetical protein A2526_00075 [candidate division WOR-1 bacterium RIFOXYD2_FULL_36_8]